MREIRIGSQPVRVRATALALLYYKQEFKSDLLGDLMKMQNIEKDPTQFDIMSIIQLIWAMAKADSYSCNKPFPSFIEWVSALENFDITDRTLMTEVMEEAAEGFFRSGAKNKPKFEKPGQNGSHRNQPPRRR
ncbi:hypothetical protein [Brevibacillus choshinensis]|uniref:hypothetical protein n=1 Tax=Brevibacillus choshinensis TaxID=54911 RepID=UPI002E2098A7|nr:hypothetical protein [Brevibacillus choshinensis]